ncbi:unnamed protein product [Thelazia callipaeda]|uniref:PX domain-containing protein n=1 Tax=Thelazia callipaeda TaxID=103827 RepID=A0A0N5D0V1_THECL|nr:unnamed protein product [Thelazia callipaeda]
MPVLLGDVSSCNSDLGRILYANPNEWNVNMNIVSINTISGILTSHVEYQLSISAIPRNCIATDARCFDMWTRYRDVKRLWEQLNDLHKKLQLHGPFPQIAEAVIFGNQRSQIIGERTSSITTFLNYVFAHPVLRQSKALQDYVLKAQEIKNQSSRYDLLEPVRKISAKTEGAFETEVVHVSQYEDEESKFLVVSDNNSFELKSSNSATDQGNELPHAVPLDMRNEVMSTTRENSGLSDSALGEQSSCNPPTYYCVALSQQSQPQTYRYETDLRPHRFPHSTLS